MQQGSLRLRLFSAAAAVISIALLLAGFTFYYLFERYVENITAFELNNHFTQLAAKVSYNSKGELLVSSPLSDPRFFKPYGGLYWQIDVAGKTPLRSRSLWDDELKLINSEVGSPKILRVAMGPHDQNLLIAEQGLSVEDASGMLQPIHVAVAIDRNQIASAVTNFSKDLIKGLGALYVVLLLGSLLQITVGLKPLEMLRQSIERIRLGTSANIDSQFPQEVQPLVDEVNSLISSRDQQLIRARERASNLAHGLKTPLTVMMTIAESLEGRGQKSSADIIHRNAQQMFDHVERELARARMASGHSTKSVLLLPIVTRVVESFQRTSQNSSLVWQIDIQPPRLIPIETVDLTELLGNLLDNAQKWAKSVVRVSFDGRFLVIEDDGPGVPENKKNAIQSRGVKLDETVPGSGLGLAIVRDIVELYSLSLDFDKSQLGGLRVSISKA
jgi:signal transduction histidine kinase